jgi:hypothetical protein
MSLESGKVVAVYPQPERGYLVVTDKSLTAFVGALPVDKLEPVPQIGDSIVIEIPHFGATPSKIEFHSNGRTVIARK